MQPPLTPRTDPAPSPEGLAADVLRELITYPPRTYLTRDGWIYVARMTTPAGEHAVKVGFSANPECRLRGLAGGVPWPIAMHLVLTDCTREMEGRLHRVLRASGARLAGEWYSGAVLPPLDALCGEPNAPLAHRVVHAVRPLESSLRWRVLQALRALGSGSLPDVVRHLQSVEPTHRHRPTGVLAVLRALKRAGDATADRTGVWSATTP